MNKVKLSEAKQGDFIKFNARSKVNWLVAYNVQLKRTKYIELWSNNGTERTIEPHSKFWNQTVIKLTKGDS